MNPYLEAEWNLKRSLQCIARPIDLINHILHFMEIGLLFELLHPQDEMNKLTECRWEKQELACHFLSVWGDVFLNSTKPLLPP